MQNSHMRYFSIFFICFGIILGIAFAYTYGTVDPTYLAKYVEFPTIYPLSEAPRTYNIILGGAVAAVFAFFAAVCYGIQLILDYMQTTESDVLQRSTESALDN